MIIGAWDIGQSTGVAVGPPDRAPLISTVRMPDAIGGNFARTTSCFLKWARDWLIVHRPDRLFVEAPFAADRRDGADLQDFIRQQFVYAGIADALCCELAIGHHCCDEVRVNDVRIHFCNDQNPGDRRIAEICRGLGWKPKNSHEADALALWHFAVVDQLELDTPFKLPSRDDAWPMIPPRRGLGR